MANVVAICGSLRKGSFNRMLMNASIGLAPAGMTIKEGPSFANLPIYNADDQASSGIPAPVQALADAIRRADGVIIVSPEYNYGLPGGLKHTIDWRWVKGHSGDPDNERVDTLARDAAIRIRAAGPVH